jgi:hypothetical protein
MLIAKYPKIQAVADFRNFFVSFSRFHFLSTFLVYV